MDDERRTIKSGPPRQLTEELDALAPALVPAPVASARYRLERVVGRGTLFVTFRATRIDEHGAVPHAVKVLRPSLARAWPSGARLLSREQARVLAILNERLPPSPHVVRLFEIGELAEDRARGVDVAVPFLAFEWIEDDEGAASLLARVRERVASTGAALSPEETLRVLEGAMRGLDWVHQHGLLHRGVSASNVLVTGRGRTLTAKITDTAIARPAGLPAAFAEKHSSAAIAFDAPYRAPEQGDLRATLTPACDVYAFGALTSFVLTGRTGQGEQQSLGRAETLHPAFASNDPSTRAALSSIESAVTMMRRRDPEARPPTVHSAWDLLAPALRVLAARAPNTRPSLSPPRARTAWMWTERHRPSAPRAFRTVAADGEGHALASEGSSLSYFDGRAFRSIDTPELTSIDTVSTASTRSFLVGGRTRLGAARLFHVSCEGTRALPLDASGTIVAAAIDGDDWLAIINSGGRNFAIDARGRMPLEGVVRISHVLRFDGTQWLIAGENDGAFVATLDPDARLVRPQATPLRRAPSAAVTLGSEAFLAAHHGVLVTVRRTLNAQRLSATREQLPTTATPSALAIAADGSLFCAAGNEIFVRDAAGGYRAPYRDAATTEMLALAVARRGMLAFLADGRVVEGRTLAE